MSEPECKTCNRSLSSVLDRQRKTGALWKNCYSCRYRSTERKRQRNGVGVSKIWTKRLTSIGDNRQLRETPKPSSSSTAIPTDSPIYGSQEAVISSPSTQTISPATDQSSLSTISNTEREVLEILSIIQEEPEPQECAVCGEDTPLENLVCLRDCTHPALCCQECIARWIQEQLTNNSWDRIRCPIEGCDVIIPHHEVKAHVSADVFNRYDELAMRSALSNDENFRFCLRPGCPSGQIHDPNTGNNIFICHICSFQVCTVHDEAFHAGETCEQYNERKRIQQQKEEDELNRIRHQEEEDKTLETIKNKTKLCPGPNCVARIEKNLGCDHMTCRRCEFEFCWRCLVPYSGNSGIRRIGNSAHESTCCHYRPNPGAQPPVIAPNP